MLLFDGGEVLKISDMGLSREVTEESMTNDQGTKRFMSPGNLINVFLEPFDSFHEADFYELVISRPKLN